MHTSGEESIEQSGKQRRQEEIYKGRVRLRVNGLLVQDNALLMVQLFSPVSRQLVWTPPGGGVQFGESLSQALQREMFEETGLHVQAGALWYMHELLRNGFHAVEFYFRCELTGGSLRLGSDPEHEPADQILRKAAFLPLSQLDRPDVYPSVLRKTFAEDLHAASVQVPRFV